MKQIASRQRWPIVVMSVLLAYLMLAYVILPALAPDIDAERDLLIRDLREADMVQNFFQISRIGPTLFGRNGEGDPYYTDGEIDVATLVVDGVRQTEPPVTLPPPTLIASKDQVWHGVSNAISQQLSGKP